MASSDFKIIPEVQKRFGIRYSESDFFCVKDPLVPSEQFLQEFEFTRQHHQYFWFGGSTV